ncbi:MAG: ATP-binding protein [Rubrivivax sp.]|jgi:two-component system sensor histidine kinase DctS
MPNRPAPVLHAAAPSLAVAAYRSAQRRRWLWAGLVVLLLVAQSLLLWLTIAFEGNRRQDQADGVASQTAAEIKGRLGRMVQDLQVLTWDDDASAQAWLQRARQALRQHAELARLERRSPLRELTLSADSPLAPPLFVLRPRESLPFEAETACASAGRLSAPHYSATYFVPLPDGRGQEVMELCLPQMTAGRPSGYVVATLTLGPLLEAVLPTAQSQRYELSFVESDGARLVRAGAPRAPGLYRAERLVDLPGHSLQLRVDSAQGAPSWVPNLPVALVGGLTLALLALVALLARDVRRRAQAEQALAESLAFRKAMEDSLVTGLRARDLRGRVTYVNPAFCAMVGFSAEELLAQSQGRDDSPASADSPAPTAADAPSATPRGVPVQRYWPPELIDEYQRRQTLRMAEPPDGERVAAAREGIETVFMRRSGERFPVMIYEAPLVDGLGVHKGWMSAVLDVGPQRRAEEQSRLQQERLQASARLATMGEMASLLSHELNQPLAAIASYAGAAQNWAAEPDASSADMLRMALQRITEQAERAGRIIKSVHSFVRRREQHHEAVVVDQLIDAVLPLVRLQSRASGTRIVCEWATPVPRVRCDRTLVEQLVLNLTRNAIQAMEQALPQDRVLTLRAHPEGPRVALEVIDQGCGIDAAHAERLFTPFYSTRREGMGLGLSLCRTVVEQHGGQLEFDSPWPPQAAGGCRFRFTLPAAPAAVTAANAAAEGPPATTLRTEPP